MTRLERIGKDAARMNIALTKIRDICNDALPASVDLFSDAAILQATEDERKCSK